MEEAKRPLFIELEWLNNNIAQWFGSIVLTVGRKGVAAAAEKTKAFFFLCASLIFMDKR